MYNDTKLVSAGAVAWTHTYATAYGEQELSSEWKPPKLHITAESPSSAHQGGPSQCLGRGGCSWLAELANFAKDIKGMGDSEPGRVVSVNLQTEDYRTIHIARGKAQMHHVQTKAVFLFLKRTGQWVISLHSSLDELT